MTPRHALTGLLSFLVATLPIETMAQGISPDTISMIRTVSDPQLSPDGEMVVYTMSTPRIDEPDQIDLWQVPATGGPAQALIATEHAEHGAAWSPDGSMIAYLSGAPDEDASQADGFTLLDDARTPLSGLSTGDGGDQIWLKPADGAPVRLTAMPGGIQGYEWSPDSTRIAFIAATPQAAEEEKEEDGPVIVDAPQPNARLWVYSLADRTARPVTPPDINVNNVSWSPDQSMFAIRYSEKPGLNDYFYRSRIAIIDADSSTVLHSIDRVSEYDLIEWSPDGSRLAWTEFLEGGVHVEPRLYDLETGEISELAQDYPGFIMQMRWTGNDALVAPSFEKTAHRFLRIDPGNDTVTGLFSFQGMATEFSLDESAEQIAYVAETTDHPTEIYLYKDGVSRRLTVTNPQTQDWQPVDSREISWESSIDGRTIYGVLVTPAGYEPGTPLKTIVQIHGGPEWYWWRGWQATGWHDWSRLLASHGYGVLLPNPRGSDGQGRAFTRAVMGDWMGADFRDTMDGVDMLVDQGIADPDKLGIGGWSYGGYTAAWAITRTDRFKAAIIGAPMTHLATMAATTDTPDYILGYLGGAAENQELYDERSPLLQIDGPVATPALILHGEKDVRVPLAQSRALYNRLNQYGGKATMVIYPDEPHWISGTANEQDILQRVVDWYDQHLD